MCIKSSWSIRDSTTILLALKYFWCVRQISQQSLLLNLSWLDRLINVTDNLFTTCRWSAPSRARPNYIRSLRNDVGHFWLLGPLFFFCFFKLWISVLLSDVCEDGRPVFIELYCKCPEFVNSFDMSCHYVIQSKVFRESFTNYICLCVNMKVRLSWCCREKCFRWYHLGYYCRR